MFDSARTGIEMVAWVTNYMWQNGTDTTRVFIGISGGADSTVVATICTKAFGPERVVGVLMPNGVQRDIDIARDVVNWLGIESIEIDISDAVNAERQLLQEAINPGDLHKRVSINTPPRVRMMTLYGLAENEGGRVSNNSNKSEGWIGYSTKYGDLAGDFSLLGDLTKTEVVQVGVYLGVPDKFIHKPPEDGLTGLSDEENFGFSYAVLDNYIRTGVCEDETIRKKIHQMHMVSQHKALTMPMFKL